jgi:flagellar L-ring protein precursor FlgH
LIPATIVGTALSASTLCAQTPPAGAAQATTAPATTAPAGTAPAGAAATGSATAAAPANAPKPRVSWTSDKRDFVVGDLITVLIDDYTVSSALKENTATDSRSRGLSLDAKLPTSSKNVGIDSRNTADQQQRGSARRENRFQNEMSVRVVAVAPNGLLQLKGMKNIDVDKSGQNVEFTGWVRPQDISASNMVESNRVADAKLGYLSPGPLGKPKSGIITKILGGLWP